MTRAKQPTRSAAPRPPRPAEADEREWLDRSYADADLANRDVARRGAAPLLVRALPADGATGAEGSLTDVRFERCDLRLAEFGGVRSSRLELEGCGVDGLGGVDGLRGARITWPDAMALLGPLVAAAGLVIRDDPECAGRA